MTQTKRSYKHRLEMYTDDALYAAVLASAEQQRLSTSSWLKQAAMEKIDRDHPTPGTIPTDDDTAEYLQGRRELAQLEERLHWQRQTMRVKAVEPE